MERGTKRKAAHAASPTGEVRAAKRIKSPNGTANPAATVASSGSQSLDTATEAGYRFVAQLRRAKDKNNRSIIDDFLKLPDKNVLPGYYEQILLPIAVETIEAKLTRREYANLSALESDVKRMVNNAKQFNENHSQVYQDAERIRKFTSNWMTKSNPAYKDKNYVAIATPLPDTPQGVPQPTPAAARSNRRAKAGASSLRSSTSAGPNGVKVDEDEVAESFVGISFQQAQERLIDELMNYEEDGLEIYFPFVNLPPRSLTDYYAIIKSPTSLRTVLRKVKGMNNRSESGGVTEFKNWDGFENEMKKIWENARIYNEDGSEIYELAGQLEAQFHERISEAKKVVDEPPQPSLKLNLGSKAPPASGLKIRLGSQKASPSPVPAFAASTNMTLPPGMTIDQIALERQKQLVASRLNNTASPLAATTPLANSIASKTNGFITGLSAGVKGEGALNTATQNAIRPFSPAMPPPPPRIPSESPLPTQAQVLTQPHIPYHAPSTGFDSKWREKGKDASDALITNLSITTHPELHLTDPLNFKLPPKDFLCQQSVTFNLPADHYYLQLEPTLLQALASGSRAYKIFVTANTQRIQQNRMPDGKTLQYDVKLAQGVNRIEVECVAQKCTGPVVQGKTELELERVAIYVHLLRAYP